MPISPRYTAVFAENTHYHIIFKSIDGLLLFRNNADCNVFIERLKQFSYPWLRLWAWSLLPNHAHLITKTCSYEEMKEEILKTDVSKRTQSQHRLLNGSHSSDFDTVLLRQINSFLISYARYYMNRYFHHGGIFQKPFHRIFIKNETHLQQAIVYTHANAQKHGYTPDFETHVHSSFPLFINDKEAFDTKEEVFAFFGGQEAFIKTHKEQIDYFYT
jgi:putative transposase